MLPSDAWMGRKGGALLSAHGREWIEELGKRPLSLYEVRDVIKGEGLIVADMVNRWDG